MKSDQRPKFRPASQGSICEKVFRPVPGMRKRVQASRVHALMVLADLRRGSLQSLSRYLQQHGGLPDREIALALQRMIEGHTTAPKFRIMVVENDAGGKRKGGRPPKRNRPPTKLEQEITAQFEALEAKGKTAAILEIAQSGVSESFVRKSVKIVRQHRKKEAAAMAEREARERSLADGAARKEAALAALRSAS